ncbi:MAG: metal-dependent transcriptional regulator [Spirochaetales bacterium]|nr:metal-dependent transcriptional regulator [Spirochaetales bacterium]
MKNKKLTSSLEDYLEAIYILENKHRVARVKDIAAHLSVQMPSVTGALRNLRDRGLVVYEKNSYINLTAEGLERAEKITGKHILLKNFLQNILLVEEEEADEEACRIEHAISQETADRLSRLINFVDETRENRSISEADWKKVIVD